MNPLFNLNSRTKVKKNVFDLSHEKKLSMNMGELVPIFLQEVVPGDKFKVSSEILVRLAPMLAPMMHRVNVYTHFFFVPNRLVYDKWQDFITGGTDGKQTPAFPKVYCDSTSWQYFYPGGLADYMGIPTCSVAPTSQKTEFNALPFRAYQLIWHEYFRDQNLVTGIEMNTGETVSSSENQILLSILRRSWEKDYFTSALPWAQRGDEVLIPTGPGSQLTTQKINMTVATGSTGLTPGQRYPLDMPLRSIIDPTDSTRTVMASDNPNALVSLSGTEGGSGSISDLRKAVRLQEWLEKNARAGGRYIEQILAHFGVRSSDARLQRPEFLGGGINPVVISEVLSTAETTDLPQGNMAGHGISVGNDNAFTRFFEEHGYIIGICSVLPRTTYQQGVPRHFLKSDKFDFYFPEFAQIGEQPVYQTELYTEFQETTPGNNAKTFGYQSRYAEYKFCNSSVHGDFRDSLSYWHMGRQFATAPALNGTFTMADPTHRVFAVTDENVHKLYVQLFNKVTAIRPMPVFGTPQL